MIERHRRFERRRGPGPYQPLERDDVEVEDGRVEGHGVGLGEERSAMTGQGPAQPHERLAQALARLALAHVRPEQPGQRLARVRPPASHGQVGQERLRLARGHGPRAGVGPQEKAAQQPQAEMRHRLDG